MQLNALVERILRFLSKKKYILLCLATSNNWAGPVPYRKTNGLEQLDHPSNALMEKEGACTLSWFFKGSFDIPILHEDWRGLKKKLERLFQRISKNRYNVTRGFTDSSKRFYVTIEMTDVHDNNATDCARHHCLEYSCISFICPKC